MANLKRQLLPRHLSMIALGGSLGTGIFLTSGAALYIGGPGGGLLAYFVMGIIVYFLMNSLGEMAAHNPVSGSFCKYASDYVSKPFGFAMGYNYWFNWAITIAVEIIAATIVMQFWFPNTNPLLWCALFFTGIFTLNVMSVRNYGEAEYWLSFIKVLAIVAFIAVGIAVIFGFNSQHQKFGFHNWTIGDAPFHGGLSHLFEVFLLSGFSFQGTELVGITAGEAKDPANSIPRAIKQIFWRIILFYIVTMTIISFVIPYTDPALLNVKNSVALSPFTLILTQAGLHYAAEVMNAVILIAVLSACNADMYSATRILWHLSEEGSAPRVFSRTNRFGIPIIALIITAAFGLLSFLCHYFASEKVFLWLVNASSLSGFVAWFGIALSHLYFRKKYIAEGNAIEDLPYRAHFYPWGARIAALVCIVIIFGQAMVLVLQHDLTWMSFLSTYFGLVAIFLLWFGKKIHLHLKKKNNKKWLNYVLETDKENAK